MKQNLTHLISLCISLLSLCIHMNVVAQEHATFDTHIHGVSELTIAIEKEQLEIEISSPAINLVGFEHKAVSAQDIATVEKAKLLLSTHNTMFSFSGGSCTLVEQSIDVSSIMQPHKTKSHSHNKSHAHNSEHKEHHHESHSNENKHHEVTAHYYYNCRNAKTLSAITVKIFDLFSGVNQINAMWITETKQGAITLNINNPIINLR